VPRHLLSSEALTFFSSCNCQYPGTEQKQLSEPSMKEQIFRDGMGVWLSEWVSAGMKMVAQ
jgi:hypothetical protein